MNYELDFYQRLKADMIQLIPSLKRVALFNNQFARYSEENSWGFPCLFIEMNPTNHMPMLRGVQYVEYTITLHIGLEGYEDEDTRMFELKQQVYKVANYFECGNWTRLERIGERPDFDHDSYQVYEMDFRTTLTDFTDDDRPKTPVTLIPEVDLEIKKIDEL